MKTEIRFRLSKVASIIMISASLIDVLMTFVLPLFYPGYNELRTPVSMLGSTASPVAGIAASWWIMLGVLFMISAVLLMPDFLSVGKPRILNILPVILLFLYGFGEGVSSGLFRSEHAGDYSTFEATLHNLLSGAGLLSSILFPLSMVRLLKSSKMKIFSVIVFLAGGLLFFLFQMRYIFPGNFLSTHYLGMWQRLLMLNFYLYLIVIFRHPHPVSRISHPASRIS